MRQPTRSRRFFAEVGERLALAVGEHAGLAEAAVLLERLHRGDRALAEVAVGQSGVVTGPVEVELDGGALRDRHAGVGAGAPGPPSCAPFFGSAFFFGAASFFAGAAFFGLTSRQADCADGADSQQQGPPLRRPTP